MSHVQVYVSKEVAAAHGGFPALTSSGTSVLVVGTLGRTPEGTLQVCCPCLQPAALMGRTFLTCAMPRLSVIHCVARREKLASAALT